MKTYKADKFTAWDELALNLLGSEFAMCDLRAVQPEETLKYVLVPPNTPIIVPDDVEAAEQVFKAPWDDDE